MAKIDEPDGGGLESDEDCEVYFLKPVNEYNIVDKIKEANKELFATASTDASDVHGGDDDTTGGGAGELSLNSRKVTFAANLENYEPADSGADGNANNNSNDSDDDDRQLNARRDDAQCAAQKLRADCKFAAIEEEADAEIKANEDAIAVLVAVDKQLTMACSQMEGQLQQHVKSSVSSSAVVAVPADDVDEICEEIVVMDMENESGHAMAGAGAGTTQRRIIKQDTFDCDTKSLTNLLASDYEEDADDQPEAKAADADDDNANSSNELDEVDLVAERQEGEGEEEYDTDNLSIIVSAYVPDEFPRLRSPSAERRTDQKPPENCKSRKLSFTKRFSFRRKSKSSPNAIAATHAPFAASSSAAHCCMQPSMTSPSDRGHQHMTLLPGDAEVTALKLHYKTCCEYRNSTLDRLPHYTGYLSEYGLSREQLLAREQRLQKKQRYVLEQTLKTTEQEMRKMQDNERAFTTWLKNKMRYPINRTRNMFDARRKSKTSPPPPPMPAVTMPPPFRRHCTARGCESTSNGCSSNSMTPYMRELGIFKHASN